MTMRKFYLIFKDSKMNALRTQLYWTHYRELKELGNSFCFIGSEYKIKLGSSYNYIDLLLYNIRFKSYVVIELKITELKKEHIGQIVTYMNYIDKNIKTLEENKTIGIIIVKKKDKYILEYCSDERILCKEYKVMI